MSVVPPFKCGDLVTTNYIPNEEHVVREVTEVYKSKMSYTGWKVKVRQCTPLARNDKDVRILSQLGWTSSIFKRWVIPFVGLSSYWFQKYNK